MERDPNLPPSHTARASVPVPPPAPERTGFFEKWRKKATQPEDARSSERPKKKHEARVERAAEAPKPERRKLGKNILGLLFSAKTQTAEAPNEQPVTPEAAPLPPTPEETPQYERATRMRRFARVVIARVLGEAGQEPSRARRHSPEAAFADTEPLVEAAHDLSDAADDLTDTIHEAREVSAADHNDAPAESRGGGYDSPYISPAAEHRAYNVEQTSAERIDDRLRQLERTAEASRTASIAAAGLGVLAVILTGTEYFSRKHNEREMKRDIKKEFKKQEKAMDKQEIAFNRLRDAQVKEMDRNQRQDYYQRLSTFTHQQTERTREANRELHEVVVQATSSPVGAPVYVSSAQSVQEASARERQPVQPERREWQPRQPETSREKIESLEPFVRVETADTVERAPGQQTGNAGTGFFGGGGGGIATGTGPSDITTLAPRVIDPNSREARQLELLRKAEQARMQQNAWLYSAALGLALIGLVIVTVVVG